MAKGPDFDRQAENLSYDGRHPVRVRPDPYDEFSNLSNAQVSHNAADSATRFRHPLNDHVD